MDRFLLPIGPEGGQRAVSRWWRRAGGGIGVVAAGLLAAAPADARWTRAQVDALPDEAFAVVQTRPDGAPLRRLPHHDAEGRLDVPHLRSALGRLERMRGLDPETAAAARRHLRQHVEELRRQRAAGGGVEGAP